MESRAVGLWITRCFYSGYSKFNRFKDSGLVCHFVSVAWRLNSYIFGDLSNIFGGFYYFSGD